VKSRRFWPLFLAGILLAGVAANVALLVVANGDPSFAVERDYYAKALRWDRTQDELRASRALGWALALAARPSARGPGWTEIEVTLTDRDGAPVPDAVVALEAFHHARAGEIFESVLAPAGPGVYRAELAARRGGSWELRLRATRGDATFRAVVQEELGGLR
jgi:nitrogen fixation protein FixH